MIPLNKCLLEEMKGRAIPKGCSHLPAGLWLLQGFAGHMGAKNQGWEELVRRGHGAVLLSTVEHSLPAAGHTGSCRLPS